MPKRKKRKIPGRWVEMKTYLREDWDKAQDLRADLLCSGWEVRMQREKGGRVAVLARKNER